MRMKIGQRKIDIKGIKMDNFVATPVMTKNLGWINNIVGKSKPVIDIAKVKAAQEAQARIDTKPQANLGYLTWLLNK